MNGNGQKLRRTPDRVFVGLFIPSPLKDALAHIARERRRSLSAQFQVYLEEGVELFFREVETTRMQKTYNTRPSDERKKSFIHCATKFSEQPTSPPADSRKRLKHRRKKVKGKK